VIKNTALTDEEKALMAQYNIRTETRTLFYSEGYKYDNLKDALSYAKRSVERELAAGNSEGTTGG